MRKHDSPVLEQTLLLILESAAGIPTLLHTEGHQWFPGENSTFSMGRHRRVHIAGRKTKAESSPHVSHTCQTRGC